MNFDIIAKDLLKQKAAPRPINAANSGNGGAVLEKANVLVELANSSFSIADTIAELRQLYDTTSEDSIKKQILDMIVKVHGLYSPEEKKEVPTIVFNLTGDPVRFGQMLCPPHADAQT